MLRDVRYPVSRNLTRAIAGLVALGLGFGAGQAEAARHAGHHLHHRSAAFIPGPGPVHESILIDAGTGRILSENNADALTYPASLTKMMTLYLTFKALNEGRLRLDTRLPVSTWAASQSPTKLGVRAGDTVSVRSLILGIVTRSANDAAVVLAEGLAGSEPAFAAEMSSEARQLGMTRTVFRNASGLPNPDQRTTARDIAQLALALYRDYPREFRFFATTEFDFRGTRIVGHDHLLNWYPGVDGIKTGFIRASGFNLATSAWRNGHHLIGVVLGGPTWGARDREMAGLLDQGFADLGSAVPAVAQITAPTGAPLHPAPIPAVAAVARTAAPPAPREAAPIPAQPGPAPHLATTTRAVALRETAPPSAVHPAAPARRLAATERSAITTRSRAADSAARPSSHSSPPARAEATAVPRPEPLPTARLARKAPAKPNGWSIQLGAFRDASAARQAARAAGSLRFVRGKPLEILPPTKGAKAKAHLYRARLLRLTAKDAENACTTLRRRRITCAVVPPAVRFARR
ncbi:MAG TPA: serine hydrolase [Stellaceae bacterium]|nr:serine hydrolase [Stellaceae bacterium]